MNNKEIKNKSVALATIVLMLGNSSCVFADNNISKDETVYSILDENGNVNRNIVSAWINSSSSLGTIHDVSILSLSLIHIFLLKIVDHFQLSLYDEL